MISALIILYIKHEGHEEHEGYLDFTFPDKY
jgi:hypothetical protein